MRRPGRIRTRVGIRFLKGRRGDRTASCRPERDSRSSAESSFILSAGKGGREGLVLPTWLLLRTARLADPTEATRLRWQPDSDDLDLPSRPAHQLALTRQADNYFAGQSLRRSFGEGQLCEKLSLAAAQGVPLLMLLRVATPASSRSRLTLSLLASKTPLIARQIQH